jgi:hypothetical protein
MSDSIGFHVRRPARSSNVAATYLRAAFEYRRTFISRLISYMGEGQINFLRLMSTVTSFEHLRKEKQ